MKDKKIEWCEIEQMCLSRAKTIMEKETAPTRETVEAVRGLVEAAYTASKAGNKSPLAW